MTTTGGYGRSKVDIKAVEVINEDIESVISDDDLGRTDEVIDLSFVSAQSSEKPQKRKAINIDNKVCVRDALEF